MNSYDLRGIEPKRFFMGDLNNVLSKTTDLAWSLGLRLKGKSICETCGEITSIRDIKKVGESPFIFICKECFDNLGRR